MQSLRSSLVVRNFLNNAASRPLRQLRTESSVTDQARKRIYFSSNAESTNLGDKDVVQQKKPARSVGKQSLRRVAVEAQRSRANAVRDEVKTTIEANNTRTATAISVADEFDMDRVSRILKSHGFILNPDGTEFDSDAVIHTRGFNNGDIFVFPSGTVVAWSLPKDVVSDLAMKTLLPAAQNPHVDQMELEDLEYQEDPKRENSSIKGDVITLGTKTDSQAPQTDSKLDKTLTKIAFSSGLARSTKLAVLETMLGKYIESTRTIPTLLSRGSRLPLNRKFMLQKTGELLELRGQLNHYSELTDSLPDIFWDSKHELELAYDQVGRALDVGVRIKTLNEKMDYAQEIATILRQALSENHSTYLEWIIIILIAVEVGFGIFHIQKHFEKEALKRAHQAERRLTEQTWVNLLARLVVLEKALEKAEQEQLNKSWRYWTM